MTNQERARWAIYHAIVAALRTQHPKRLDVARALDDLAARYRTEPADRPETPDE